MTESVALLATASISQTWFDQPAALTEVFGSGRARVQFNASTATEARVAVNTRGAGAAGAEICAQYSTDDSNWQYLGGANGPCVDIASTGPKSSSWVNLPAAAKADVYLRIVGRNGDGAADPSFSQFAIQFR